MSDKKRNWSLVLYPESLPENWRDILQQTGLPISVSPLHDCDSDPNGEVKKPHYHVIVCYPGPTTFNVVRRLADDLHAPIPIPLDSVRGMYRYFWHKDNPEKFQYSDGGNLNLNGFDILDFVELTKSEVLHLKRELQSLIRERDFTEYADFMDYLQDGDNMSWYEVASSNTYFFEKYLASRRHMRFKDEGR